MIEMKSKWLDDKEEYFKAPYNTKQFLTNEEDVDIKNIFCERMTVQTLKI